MMHGGTLWTVEGLTNGPARVKVVSFVVVFICLLFLDGAEALSHDGVHLLAFKKAFTTCASSEVGLADWDENDSDPCAWSGVECDPESLRVVSLRIVGKGGAGGQHRTQSACRVPYRRGGSLGDDGSGGGCGGDDREPCELSGALSPAIWKLSKLRRLLIPFNNLTGEIPKDVAHLKALRILDLRSNLLEGTLPSELGKLPKLRLLNLDNNAFQGTIPAELSLCQELRGLSLAGNMLSGSIPASLGSLPHLHRLSLSNNQLVGSIPRELVAGDCTLSHLDLSGNRLSGNIPAEITACSRLTKLLLNFNNLVGSIPSDLGHLSSLKALEVAGNSLSGLLPAQLAECSKLEFLVLTSHPTWSACLNRMEGNSFRGALPPGLALLPNLRVLWAPAAGLSGHLPVDWGRCKNLESLNLGLNVLTGEISLGLRNCKSLVFLDLSSNQLTGTIPSQLPVKSTRVFNVTGNVLSGRVSEVSADSVGLLHLCNSHFPSGSGTYRFGYQPEWQTKCVLNWSYDNFKGDVALPSLRRIMLDDYSNSFASTEGPASSQMQSRRKLNSILVAAITSGCAIAVVLFVLGLVFQCTRHRMPRRPAPQPGRKVVVTFTNINYNLTYESVVKATGNFSIDNLIGSGGFGATYKAEVKPGLLVAVKRLAIGKCQGVQQFDTEIRTLGRIRHPNLVTLIGYHASQDSMFLIYNFFSKGNLETLIHGQKEEMDWKTRHSIALRIAEALAYLHDECLPRVLHRDIKPSNILLDDNLNAHLSDFGLARLLGASETHATTDVAGTFGYVAPEYAMTCRVTDKADVYSYGVVLLELLSGKRALDPSFSEYGNGFNIVSWACLLIRQGRACEVFTVRLWEMGHEKPLLETLKLAVLCTVDQLSVRPTMRKVVDTLGEIRPVVSTT